jgi:uncharacterized protein YndB with AHSA1/START domain
MPNATGSYEQVGGSPVVRFERTFPHPTTQVWDAITDPARPAQWFPTSVEFGELRAGAPISFRFEEDRYPPMSGAFCEVLAPRRLSFTWGEDVLTFELEERGGGAACRLSFSVMLDSADKAARDAAGWMIAWTCWISWSLGGPRRDRGSRRDGGVATTRTSARDSLLPRIFRSSARRPPGRVPWRYTP